MRDCVIGFQSLLYRNWSLERRINHFEDILWNRGELIICEQGIYLLYVNSETFLRESQLIFRAVVSQSLVSDYTNVLAPRNVSFRFVQFC